MLKSFEARKTLSTIVCTLLFSTTCIVSAVGPAGAVPMRAEAPAVGTLA